MSMKRRMLVWVMMLCLALTALPVAAVRAESDALPSVAVPPSEEAPAVPEEAPEDDESEWWTDLSPYRSGDFMVIVREGAIEIGEYCGTDSTVVVPKEIDGLPVSAIWPEAFESYERTIVSVEVQAELTSINGAFSVCRTLETVVLPDTVKVIGLEAFLGCHSLVSIDLPDGVTVIGPEAFSNCDRLETIRLPEGITVIDDFAFWGCSSLTAINIPAGVTSIGEEAFWGCSSLSSISIPAGVTSIGADAFYGCDALAISVVSGSYAETYCREHRLNYTIISE